MHPSAAPSGFGAAGNLTTDAHLAALAIGRGAILVATATSHDSRVSGGRTRWLLPGDGGGRLSGSPVRFGRDSRLRSPHLERARGAVSELRGGSAVLGRVVPRDDLPAVPFRRRAPAARTRGDRRRRRARSDVLALQGRNGGAAGARDRQAVPDRRAPPALDRRGDVGRVARRASRTAVSRGSPRRRAALWMMLPLKAPARARLGQLCARPSPSTSAHTAVRGRRGPGGHVRLGRGRPSLRRPARPVFRYADISGADGSPRARSTTATTPASTVSTWDGSSSSRLGIEGLTAWKDRKSSAKAQALNCPACGGALELRDPANTVRVACSHCGSILGGKDETSPPDKFAVVRKLTAVPFKPSIPPGSGAS